MTYFIVFLIGAIPLLILIYSLIDRQKGKRERVNWKWAGISFAGNLIGYIGLSFYYKYKFDFPIFPNLYDINILLIIAGAIFVIVGGISLFVYFDFRGRDVPKSVHDPKLLPVITFSVPLFLIYIGIILLPITEKINYSVSMDMVIEMTENYAEDKEFSVILTLSDNKCLDNSSSCRDSAYKNYFFVKNNLEKSQEVQVSIRAYKANKEIQMEINSNIIQLEPGEIKLITTEDSPTKTSPWNNYSFETDKRIEYYDYAYRYRDIE
ncbi:hypothetical protein [Ornithinibacillus halotolerans]|uniref:Uncharacterized protein n=1 Tax=Ornithinibacillus halotolerans TaxID=1274357 RepID=A0A916W1M9_9BACI|nr:hypothetical protein [Ornithinibacillus halotolerans]GGA60320.1 hypothetical protein GCM10008025_00410 [Ornithinibacillus halotolerans]